ncbi:MAG: hypothetical protein NVS3B26_25670 [Mycobacteriales bacterium]
MHAVYIEVDNPHTDLDTIRASLEEGPVPRSRQAGATAAYWLAPVAGRMVVVLLFDSAEQAEQLAARLHVGEAPEGALDGVIFRTVEVREVLASV